MWSGEVDKSSPKPVTSTRRFDDLHVPLEQGELLLLERLRAHGQEEDRAALHDELVHVLDEHEGLEEAVVDDQVLKSVQEDGPFPVVVLDELLDHLREGADRRG